MTTMNIQNNKTPEVPMSLFKDERCYRPDEIADTLHVDRCTVYRMIRDIFDPLPAYRINKDGPLRVHGKDINTYLDNHKVQPHNE